MPQVQIKGTTFVVDDFKSRPEGACHLLSHFHTDHYQGILKKMRVYASPLTCQLVGAHFKCETQALPLNLPFEIRIKVLVTAIPANHCPGAVMFLLEDLWEKKLYLFTGDFKYDLQQLECQSWSCIKGVHKLFVDSTYLATKTRLEAQAKTVQNILGALKQHFVPGRTKVICQTYSVGKERVFEQIARELKIKFYSTSKTRVQSLKTIYGAGYDALFTDQDNDLGVLDALYGQKANQFREIYKHFKKVIVVTATGWEKSFRVQAGPQLVQIRAPYSEHCDYDELLGFCRMVAPKEIESIISEADTKTLRALLQTNKQENQIRSQLHKSRPAFEDVDVQEQAALLAAFEKKKQVFDEIIDID